MPTAVIPQSGCALSMQFSRGHKVITCGTLSCDLSLPRLYTVVQKFVSEKAKEIEIVRGEGEHRPFMERDGDSDATEEHPEKTRKASFQRGFSLRGRSLPAPLIFHNNIFRANLFRESVDEFKTWIVDAAAEAGSSTGDTFSFPAVRVIVPSAWVDATDAVKALGERKGLPYVMWGEAVEAFQQHFQAKRDELLQDAAGVLRSAMEHREAEGAVILSLKKESSPGSDDMIHLDPRWLIELVRRVSDHNLVDKSKQTKVKRELEAYCATQPLSRRLWSQLWDTHT